MAVREGRRLNSHVVRFWRASRNNFHNLTYSESVEKSEGGGNNFVKFTIS